MRTYDIKRRLATMERDLQKAKEKHKKDKFIEEMENKVTDIINMTNEMITLLKEYQK